MSAPKGNRFALGNDGGRPRIYDNPEDLLERVISYFDTHDKPTITGLTLYLGFCDMSTLYDYEQRQEFSLIIKSARLAVAESYEERLHGPACTGAIFALKNMRDMGWKDKQETEHTGMVEFIVKEDR